jgi:uncharacterized membrane protein
MTSDRLRLATAIAAIAFTAACESSWESAACPPEGTELTYESFGRGFIGAHCQSCHASNVEDRKGAPKGISFDSHDDVVEWIDRIYDRSTGDNTSMPPGPEDPAEEDRFKLEVWLACGAP